MEARLLMRLTLTQRMDTTMIASILMLMAFIAFLSGGLAIGKGADKNQWQFKNSQVITDTSYKPKVYYLLWASTAWSVIHIISVKNLEHIDLQQILYSGGISIILIAAHILIRNVLNEGY